MTHAYSCSLGCVCCKINMFSPHRSESSEGGITSPYWGKLELLPVSRWKNPTSEGVPVDFFDWEVGISQFRVQLERSIKFTPGGLDDNIRFVDGFIYHFSQHIHFYIWK